MKRISKYTNVVVIIFVFAIVVILYLSYQNYILNNKNKLLTDVLSKKTLDLKKATETLGYLKNNLETVVKEKNKLGTDLNGEISKVSLLQKQVKNIIGTVGTLKKLSNTDKELLKKYSKVYFLSENYIPSKLTQINTKYLYNKNKSNDKWVHALVYPYLQMMFASSGVDGVNLLIESAYRSFTKQTKLKNQYSIIYGSGANKFSADQGYSEHQLGTTIDFTTLKTGDNFSEFKNTNAYKWLVNNAYKFGFVLSYPDKNKYYISEPWHWRFVGVKLAKMLHLRGIYFYDLTQREIDKYLVNIFD